MLRIRVGKTLPILSFMLSITRYLLFSSFLLLMQPLFTKGQHARLKIPQTSIWDHELIKNLFTWVKKSGGTWGHFLIRFHTIRLLFATSHSFLAVIKNALVSLFRAGGPLHILIMSMSQEQVPLRRRCPKHGRKTVCTERVPILKMAHGNTT